MPDDSMLAKMYLNGHSAHSADASVQEPAESDELMQWLKKRHGSVFIDYGCGGNGSRLVQAQRLGWHAIGVEFNEGIARMAEERSGVRIISRLDVGTLGEQVADIIYLGDVIEHLTDPGREMVRMLKVLRRGGLLISSGPLEANTTLFNLVLRVARWCRQPRPKEMAPYHVILATANGQRILFRRLGLDEVEFRLQEVSWPAATGLSVCHLSDPRSLGLYALRRVSQLVSKARSEHWGNRYSYVGRWHACEVREEAASR